MKIFATMFAQREEIFLGDALSREKSVKILTHTIPSAPQVRRIKNIF